MIVYTDYTDLELVRLVAEGDERAYTELFERYWERMVMVARAKLGNTEDAKEVVQIVFIDLWNRRQKLSGVGHVEHYIAVSVKYQVLAHLGRAYRREQVEAAREMVDADDQTRAWLDFQDLQAQLERSVNRLPEKCQLVYRLSRQSGLSTQEIANEMGISQKTAEAHLTKALKTIRKDLGSALGFLVILF